MAKEKTPENKVEKAAPAKKRSGKLKFFFFMLLFIAALPFIVPTFVLILVGMIPTFVALITDTDRQKSSATAIGAMNCAGLTPFILDLWCKGQTMETLTPILKDPASWFIILGAAGVGQLIVFTVPQAMASLTLARAEGRMKNLKENLESLKATWGADVGTTKSLDKLSRGE